jgi:hypothetical protein
MATQIDVRKAISYGSMVLVLLIMGFYMARMFSRSGDGIVPWQSNQQESSARELSSAQEQISQLSQQIAGAEKKAEAAKPLLDPIRLENAKFYWSQSGYIEQPVIAFRVTNGGKIPLKRVYVHGVLFTPGRAIPWVDDDFNYEFNGGLDVGETQDLALEPNMFGPWAASETKGRADLVLKLSVKNFEGPDGKAVVDDDAANLAEKRDQLRQLQKRAPELSKVQ